jgi:hypothetical protein
LVNWLAEFFNREACLYWRAFSSGSDSPSGLNVTEGLYWRASSSGSNSLWRKRETREAASNAAREVTRLGGTVGGSNFETFGAVSLVETLGGLNSGIFGAVSLAGSAADGSTLE